MKEKGLQLSSNFHFDAIRHFTLHVHFLDDIHEQHMGFVLTFFCSAKFFSYFSLLLLQVYTLVLCMKYGLLHNLTFIGIWGGNFYPDELI